MRHSNNEQYAYWEAPNAFCHKYEPAMKTDMTNIFSTIEIQKLIKENTGINISLDKLSEMLTQLQYYYLSENENRLWIVKSL